MTPTPVDPEPQPGGVVRAGEWAVANRDGEFRAVSRRCRHQLADLSEGWLDDEGCLVCPWHHSEFDLDSGKMVKGPQGFLFIRRHIPGYDALVKSYSRILVLRRRAVERRDGRLEVQ